VTEMHAALTGQAIVRGRETGSGEYYAAVNQRTGKYSAYQATAQHAR
jgi:hypothetical protein